jgi:hypothetical protein
MTEPTAGKQRDTRNVVPRGHAGMPAKPVILQGEQVRVFPTLMLDGTSPTIGWEFRPAAKAGVRPCRNGGYASASAMKHCHTT